MNGQAIAYENCGSVISFIGFEWEQNGCKAILRKAQDRGYGIALYTNIKYKRGILDQPKNNIVAGYDIAKIRACDPAEVERFYNANQKIIRQLIQKYCRNKLDYYFGDVDDLNQQAYLVLPQLDYVNNATFFISLWREFDLYTRQTRYEATRIRLVSLDAPLTNKNDTYTLGSILPYRTANHNRGDDILLDRLLDWLKGFLTAFEYRYVYMRYVEYVTNEDIFAEFGYSTLCGNRMIEALDKAVMTKIRERYAELAFVIGDIAPKYKDVLPQVIEYRKTVMQMFQLKLVG